MEFHYAKNISQYSKISINTLRFFFKVPTFNWGEIMPGGYAHITLVNILSQKIADDPTFSEEALSAVMDYLKFVELGAVSPDYPYRAVSDRDEAKKWGPRHALHTNGGNDSRWSSRTADHAQALQTF